MSNANLPHYPNAYRPQATASGGTGLATSALVCGIAGFCVPLVGIVGIILGVIALTGGRTNGRGMAVGGIVTGAASLLLSTVLVLALLLPALGAARDTAREVKSSTQMRQIAMAIVADASSRSPFAWPAGGTNLEQRLSTTIDPSLWSSPRDPAPKSEPSYLYIPPTGKPGSEPAPMLIERPTVDGRRLNVAFDDGHVETRSRADAEALLRTALPNVFTADGKRWTPTR